eukprot:11092561-Ditylum_brightwellii.AAC.1
MRACMTPDKRQLRARDKTQGAEYQAEAKTSKPASNPMSQGDVQMNSLLAALKQLNATIQEDQKSTAEAFNHIKEQLELEQEK